MWSVCALPKSVHVLQRNIRCRRTCCICRRCPAFCCHCISTLLAGSRGALCWCWLAGRSLLRLTVLGGKTPSVKGLCLSIDCTEAMCSFQPGMAGNGCSGHPWASALSEYLHEYIRRVHFTASRLLSFPPFLDRRPLHVLLGLASESCESSAVVPPPADEHEAGPCSLLPLLSPPRFYCSSQAISYLVLGQI